MASRGGIPHGDLFDDGVGLRTVGGDRPLAGDADAIVTDVGIFPQVGFKSRPGEDRDLAADQHGLAVGKTAGGDTVHGGGLARRSHADGDDSAEIHGKEPLLVAN